MRWKIYSILSLILIISMVFSGCNEMESSTVKTNEKILFESYLVELIDSDIIFHKSGTITKRVEVKYRFKNLLDEKRISKEFSSLYTELEKTRDPLEKDMINSQIKSLENSFKNINKDIREILEELKLIKSLHEPKKIEFQEKRAPIKSKPEKIKERKYEKEILKSLEKETLKRLAKKEKKVEKKKEKKASSYIRTSNKLFGKLSSSLLEKGWFKGLKRDLVKANMRYLAKSYVSVIFFTTLLSLFASMFIFIFFLFFNFGAAYPFFSMFEGNIINRIGSIFWILIIFPLGTFLFAYFYPSLEKKAIETRINQELPFATIHMSSISESLVEPSNIFKIIISTKEYPTIEKEFIKLLNEINVFGHDLVTALRNVAFNNPSRKLAELFDGLATTITSGGDLSDFFDKRAQTLLFDYKLEREKKTKTAETFMDIYISVVIAAPMIFMLLLIMMRVSGLGIALSTSMISLIMVLGVSVVNVIFLVFLQLRQPKE